jgi:lysophospholipase L1-like esterase
MNARSSLAPALAGAALLTLVLAGALPALAGGQTAYYLALGDSLAQGVQPNLSGASVETTQGYADDLYGLYRAEVVGLQLAKLGCPGETTTTMIHGGICYPAGTSQLDRAVAFLRSHHVVLVTIDIGANNVLPCVGLSGIDTGCINQGVGEVAHDLPYILQQLRAAAGAGVPIVAMNYYDPVLAEWLQGPAGQALAKQSVQFTVFFNNVLESIYAAAGVPVADVQAAFQTTTFTPGLPLNVTLICAWTWMCAPSPVGPNIHPNAVGYWVIAGTFAKTIGVIRSR